MKINLTQDEIDLIMECLDTEGENTMSAINRHEASPDHQGDVASLTESYEAIDTLYTRLKNLKKRIDMEYLTPISTCDIIKMLGQ